MGVRGEPRQTVAWWPLVVALLTIIPILGVFTTAKVFYVRDLTFFFWSRHLWFRHTVLSGALPLWDPYMAGGQSAVADALNQVFMPLTTLVRLLPSDVVSFNVWVALPVPLSGLGMYAFLRRRASPSASTLGACAFGLSGPIVSMLNAPNLSWSVAAMPWVMWAVDRLVVQVSVRRCGLLAVIIALQALAGEPVTLASTAVVALAYAANHRHALRSVLWVAAAGAAGALLAAGQLGPTIASGIAAHRGAVASPDFWSLHPLGAIELVAPHLFGNYYDAFLASMPWMSPLNSGREPFYYSIYVGPLVLLLAAAATAAHPRRSLLWCVIGVVFLIAAMGKFTPAYPLLRTLLPPLAYFRFPVKYLVVTVFAAAVLAADGWDAAGEDARRSRVQSVGRWAGILAACAAVAVVSAAVAPQPWWHLGVALARRVPLPEPGLGADFLLRVGPPLFARCVGLLLAGSALLFIAASGTGRHRAAAAVLFVALCGDLAVATARLNPTTEVSKISAPEWYRKLASGNRVYIGGRVRGYMDTKDPDATQMWHIPAESTAVEGRMELNAELPMAPSGWGVREALSYDLPVLWPREYELVVRRFERASPQERGAFLRRSGVRWCVLPDGARPDLRHFADIPHWQMQLYDCNPAATRTFITYMAEADAGADRQREALFDPDLDDAVLRLDGDAPPAAGESGPPAPASARIVQDGTNTVEIEAALPREGFVVLRDSYDPSWRASVDGVPAVVGRANALYRAVRVPAGRHVVRFTYRPRIMMVGLIVSGVTVLLLGGSAIRAAETPSC